MRYSTETPRDHGRFARTATAPQLTAVRGMAFRARRTGVITEGHLQNVLGAFRAGTKVSFQEARREITRLQAMLRRARPAEPVHA